MSPRPSLRQRIGAFTTLGALVVAVTAITVAALGSFSAFSGLSAMRHALVAPSAPEIEAALARVGITPATLAAAGADAEDAANVGADARAYLNAARWNALERAEADLTTAQRDLTRLEKLVRAGQSSRDDRNDLATARAILVSSRSTQTTAHADLFDAATADLDPRQIAAIETMHANRGRTVPIHYTINDRTDAEWTSLRDALANIKTAGMCDEDPDADCNQLVLDCNAETEVVAAKINLDNNLQNVADAMRAAIGR